ncbi:MAG: polysaccharide biosynthesis protein [Nonlabens sp.]|uniref:polysaccharide biosynthesis protein n=1 Tax=Nonlabens sp. TaxID=1888209 RepID=UPI003EF6E8D0
MTWDYFKKRLSHVLLNGDNDLKFRNISYLPRWAVVAIDSFLVIISFLITYFLIKDLMVSLYPSLSITQQGGVIFLVQFSFFFIFSTYAGLIRHSTTVDILKIALACFTSGLTLVIINYTSYFLIGQKLFLMPFLAIFSAITFGLMLLFRVSVKSVYYLFINLNTKEKKRVLLLGVNDDTISVAEAMTISRNQDFILAGFISFTKAHSKIKILGKPIFKYSSNVYGTLKPYDIDGVVIVGNTISQKQKNNVVDECLNHGIQIFNAPVIKEWNDSQSIQGNIKEIQIEDLLERNPIVLDDSLINKYINDRVILVTGGAGSIGSEIVRQVAQYKPTKLLVLDQAESPLHELELELRGEFNQIDFEFVLGDVRNLKRMRKLFESEKISMVFHAAAYKHVPLIENNPSEAVFVNIIGTMNLANLSAEYGIDRFVMVSTDKAVNPTNVMGASKRAAEIYVQALQAKETNTCFITTRFGNVLGSNGSVIPHFKKQIAAGGPVTVTHQDIIRYFMTIPEACQLVLQAGTMGQGGEVFVFDMGKPVRIMDLAEKMIKLSGLEPYKQIDIKVIGLRPGEKLFEELLNDKSTTLPTHHKKIMVARDKAMELEDVNNFIIEIAAAAEQQNNTNVVAHLKKLMPEFISQNSVYEVLDKDVEVST